VNSGWKNIRDPPSSVESPTYRGGGRGGKTQITNREERAHKKGPKEKSATLSKSDEERESEQKKDRGGRYLQSRGIVNADNTVQDQGERRGRGKIWELSNVEQTGPEEQEGTKPAEGRIERRVDFGAQMKEGERTRRKLIIGGRFAPEMAFRKERGRKEHEEKDNHKLERGRKGERKKNTEICLQTSHKD